MVDLSAIGKEAGLPGRTLITPAAWGLFDNDGQFQGEGLQERLLSMLRILHIAMTRRRGPREDVVYFSTHLENGQNNANKLTLKAAIESHSSGQPVITVMLPSEGSGMKRSQGKGTKRREGERQA
jgi:hypothetical protein